METEVLFLRIISAFEIPRLLLESVITPVIELLAKVNVKSGNITVSPVPKSLT